MTFFVRIRFVRATRPTCLCLSVLNQAYPKQYHRNRSFRTFEELNRSGTLVNPTKGNPYGGMTPLPKHVPPVTSSACGLFQEGKHTPETYGRYLLILPGVCAYGLHIHTLPNTSILQSKYYILCALFLLFHGLRQRVCSSSGVCVQYTTSLITCCILPLHGSGARFPRW